MSLDFDGLRNHTQKISAASYLLDCHTDWDLPISPYNLVQHWLFWPHAKKGGKKETLTKVSYHYNSINSKIGDYVKMFREENEGLVKIINQKTIIYPKETLSYILYSSHYIDTTDFYIEKMYFYRLKMLEENKDTLHVGTVNEFRKKHPELFKMLTKKDSISTRLIDRSSKTGLGDQIKIAVAF